MKTYIGNVICPPCKNLIIKRLDSDLQIIGNRKNILVQRVKNEIDYLVHESDGPLTINLSVHLSQKFDYDYTYLATLFSDHFQTTLEKYFIGQRIERVKRLIVCGFRVTEISEMLNYCSAAHCSAQFKKVTGITPTQYRHYINGMAGQIDDTQSRPKTFHLRAL